MEQTKENNNISKIAVLVAISCVLQIAESLIPHPIPGLRLGLANVMTLIALVTLGFTPALEVAILRTVLSSFIMGTFMSPGFILSFAGAFISTLVMGLLYWLSGFNRRYRLSIVGISILSALTHNIVQLCLAYFILVRHKGIFVFLPWLCIGAVAMGWLTGVVAGNVCLKLKMQGGFEPLKQKNQAEHFLLELRHYSPGNSLLHRLGADRKIIGIFVLALTVLIFTNLWFYVALFLFLGIVTLNAKVHFSFLFLKLKKSASLIFISFLFPVFFNSGTHVLAHVASFRISSEGLSLGSIFALRVLFLILASSLLIKVTSPQDLTRGFTKVLLPLRFLGVSQRRIAGILSLSWMAVPIFWEMARNAIGQADLKRTKSLRNLIPLLSDIIASLYLEAGQIGALSQEDNFSLNAGLVSENVSNLQQEFLRKEEVVIAKTA